MGGEGYVPLRVHGWHSMMTGVDGPGELLGRAAELGCPALALTDLDGQAGMVEFLLAARGMAEQEPRRGARAVRPIVGAELSDPHGEGRVVALVQDRRGYANLCKLISARHLGRDPGRFGADLGEPEQFDLARALAEHQEGLVLLVDHPRLLVALHGRVERGRMLAALSPAGLAGAARGDGSGAARGPRNTHLAARDGARHGGASSGASSGASGGASGAGRGGAPDGRARRAWAAGGEGEGPEDEAHQLEPPKAPPPARAVAAGELLAAARAVGVAVVAVPDVYCAREAGWAVHRARVAVKHNALRADLPEGWVAQRPAHLLPFEELCRLYANVPDVAGAWKVEAPAGVPACVARTLAVAESCAYVPELGGVLFPRVELEAGETAYSKLSGLALEGARRRYRPLRPEVLRRLDHELTTIEDLGFAPYFLLVQKIRDWAAREGIPCVGRGSAADSLVAYCLELTDADPLRYRLIFERFLNPARRDRPDIDLDFCWRRRDAVIEHVYELFGATRTAMISTLNTCGLRAAFRETALTEGLPPSEVNRWSRRLPHALPPAQELAGSAEGAMHLERALGATHLERALRATPELREFPSDDPRWRRVLRLAERLEGAPRHFGLHPGGVVVAPGAITDFAACQRAAKGVVVTQLDKDGVEALGLVKMDLLGNRALTVIDDCTRELRARGIEVDLEAIDEQDPDTARTLREGRTIACFQVESPGMRNLLQQTGAADMDAVIQAVALIRPGPAASGMKDAYVRRFRGLEPPTPPHPRLTELLWDAQGVLLYQEDVMQVAALLAGMDLAEADLLRRALQKRRAEELEGLARRFLAGCARNGVTAQEARGVWELVANFAAFGFCKAHAVTYGRISYRTAWLKTHFPAVFLTAFLASHTGYYAERVYVEEARRLGVPILAPDVNQSGLEHAVEWRAGIPALRLGLGLVKGLTQRTLEALLAARASGGPFLSLPDLLERSGARTDEAQALIQCGALDAFDRTRPELLWRLHLLRAPERRAPRDAARLPGAPLDPATLAACRATPRSRTDERIANARSQSGGWSAGLGGLARLGAGESASLFPTPESPALALPALPDLGPKERGYLEWELLGLTLAAHPTRLFPCPADERLAAARAPGRPALGARPVNPIPCARLASLPGGRVTLRGWPAATRRVRTADGRWMRFLTLEDESGLAEAVLFPDVYERDGHRLAEFGTLCLTGIVQDQLGACTLAVERVW